MKYASDLYYYDYFGVNGIFLEKETTRARDTSIIIAYII